MLVTLRPSLQISDSEYLVVVLFKLLPQAVFETNIIA